MGLTRHLAVWYTHPCEGRFSLMLQRGKRCGGVLLLSLLMVGAVGIEFELHAEGSCEVCHERCFKLFGIKVACWESCTTVTPCGGG